jgi:hypothetical protein
LPPVALPLVEEVMPPIDDRQWTSDDERPGVGERVRLRLRLRVSDYGQLSRLLGKLDGLAGVEHARRA